MFDGPTVDVLVRAIGWALLHSVWQGAMVGALVALVLYTLRRGLARHRYVVASLGLAAMVASWGLTAAAVMGGPVPASAPRATVRTVELGPAGPRDMTPAIRVLTGPAALEMPPDATWQGRLDTWSYALVPVWFVGVLMLSTRLALGWRAVERLRGSARLPLPQPLAERVAVLIRRMRIRRAVQVVQSTAVQVPTAIGWLRPLVLMPVSVLAGLAPAQLEAIVAHELAHVRRHDFAVNVLQRAAEILLFYHPACWWISHQIRVEREHCCDDVAVAVCGDGVVYAATLAELESLRREAGLSLAATDGPLLQRVRRVIAPSHTSDGGASWTAVSAPLALVALLVLGAQWAATAAAVQQSPVAPTAGPRIPANEGFIQGRIVEANSSRPVPGASIQLVGPEGTAAATSDDQGRYEVRGLKPGLYTLSVRATGFVTGHYGQSSSGPMDFGASVVVQGGRIVSGIDVRLAAAGSISGRITGDQGTGVAGVEVELVRQLPFAEEPRTGAVAFAQTVGDGSYQLRDVTPGDYYVRAYTTRDAEPAGRTSKLVYAPTFYPGVPVLGEAQPLRIYAGQDLLDVDFALGTSTTHRISGTVMDPSGESIAGLEVVMHPMSASGGPGEQVRTGIDAEGRFEIRDVRPGQYMLNVLDRRLTSRWVGAMGIFTVDGDLTGLELRASLGARVEGRVVRDVAATATLDLSSMRVQLEKRIDSQLWGFVGAGFSKLGDDGTFSLESAGGPVLFKINDVPSGWMVKAIMLDGIDVGDGPVDFGSGRRHVEVILTDRVSGVFGVVVDRSGRPLPNYSVVIFPGDPTRWHDSSRFILSARSNSAGQFRIDRVPPGEYRAVAVAALPVNAWQNPKVLERLLTGAEQIRIGEGQQLTISIRASPTLDVLGARLELAARQLRLMAYVVGHAGPAARPGSGPSPAALPARSSPTN